MKICIDARWIFQEISGIGLYTQELIRALARVDRNNEYLLIFNETGLHFRTLKETDLAAAENFQCRIFPYGIFSLSSQMALPSLLRKSGVDVYHSTNYMMPMRSCGETRRVVTIHDLIPLMFRDHAPKSKKSKFFPVYQKLMREVGKSADRIIAVGESTKRDIVRELRVAPEKIDVTLEGVMPQYWPADKKPRGEKVILFVGRRDPYKNLPLLIQAISGLKSQVSGFRLRIIGPPDERYPEAPELARKLGLEKIIDWIGYAAPEQLLAEYQQADVFVLPSQYEGFGLTVLEAMACGTPVVCSDVSSLPEVVGDAGLLVPPNDAAALTDALRRVLTDERLAGNLSERGLRRAAQFTWEKTARATLQAYAQANKR